jgi:hypothetical protein
LKIGIQTAMATKLKPAIRVQLRLHVQAPGLPLSRNVLIVPAKPAKQTA